MYKYHKTFERLYFWHLINQRGKMDYLGESWTLPKQSAVVMMMMGEEICRI